MYIFVNNGIKTIFCYTQFRNTVMAQTLQIIHIVSSIALVILVLLQRVSSDTGSTLGGDGSSFLQTRRGAERFLFVLTIIVAIVFVAASLFAVLLPR
jgi:protein translocase SecG subunit